MDYKQFNMEQIAQDQLVEIKLDIAELKSNASTHATKDDLDKYYTKTDIDQKAYISAIPKLYVQDHELETLMSDWETSLDLDKYATKEYVNSKIDGIEFPTYTPPTGSGEVSYTSRVSGENTYLLGILTSGNKEYPIIGKMTSGTGGGTGGGEGSGGDIEIPEREPAISPVFIFSAGNVIDRNLEGVPSGWYENISNVTSKPIYMSTAKRKGTQYLRWEDGYVWTEPIEIIAANIVDDSRPSSPNTVVLTEDEFNHLKENGALTPNTLYIVKDSDGNLLYMVTTDSNGDILAVVNIVRSTSTPSQQKITLSEWYALKQQGQVDANTIYIVTSEDGATVVGIGISTVLTRIPDPSPDAPDIKTEVTSMFSQHATFNDDGTINTLKWSIMDTDIPGELFATTGFEDAVKGIINTSGFVATSDFDTATSEMFSLLSNEIGSKLASVKTEIVEDTSFVTAVADKIELNAVEELKTTVQNITDGIIKSSDINQSDNSITLSVIKADETGDTSASVAIMKLYNDPDDISKYYLAADHVKFESEDYENIARHVTVSADNIDLQGLVNAQDTLTVGGGSSVFNKSGSGWVASKGIRWDSRGTMTVHDMYGTGNTIPGQTYITAGNFFEYFYQSDIDKDHPVDGKQVYVPRLDRLGRVIIVQSLPEGLKLSGDHSQFYGLVIAFPHIGFLGYKDDQAMWSMRTGDLNMLQLYALDGLSYMVVSQNPKCWIECAYGKIYTNGNSYVFNYEYTDSYPGSLFGLRYVTHARNDTNSGVAYKYNVFPELIHKAVNVNELDGTITSLDAIPIVYVDNGTINDRLNISSEGDFVQPSIPNTIPQSSVININVTISSTPNGDVAGGYLTNSYKGTFDWLSSSPIIGNPTFTFTDGTYWTQTMNGSQANNSGTALEAMYRTGMSVTGKILTSTGFCGTGEITVTFPSSHRWGSINKYWIELFKDEISANDANTNKQYLITVL